MPAPDPDSTPQLFRFTRRALVVAGIVTGALALWSVHRALLLAFLSVTLATLLVSFGDLLRRVLPLSHRWGVTLAAVLIVVLIGGAVTLTGSQVRAQFEVLWPALVDGVGQLEDRFGFTLVETAGGTGNALLDSGITLGSLAETAAAFGLKAASVLAGLVLVIFGGIFFAMAPNRYVGGIVKLFPRPYHARITEVFDHVGRALTHWLVAKVVAMVIIGLALGIVSRGLGLPAPVALGLFAGLVEFVPILGPIIAAVPVLLLAFSVSNTTFFWALGLVIVVQQIESNVLIPLLQERAVSLPSALLLFTIIGFGALFGLLGFIVAAPLTVVLFVLVRELYVRDTLGIAPEED